VCRRTVWAPAVSVGGASVLRANVNQQWGAYLEDPTVHMFVNETNVDDGYNNPLHWWKEHNFKYIYIIGSYLQVREIYCVSRRYSVDVKMFISFKNSKRGEII
jgi:hypothetical protein